MNAAERAGHDAAAIMHARTAARSSRRMRGRIVPEFEHARVRSSAACTAARCTQAAAILRAALRAAPGPPPHRRSRQTETISAGARRGDRAQPDGNRNGSGSPIRHHRQGATNVAVTTVLIPPRTEKSPTTVMRRGCSAAIRSSRIWFVTFS